MSKQISTKTTIRNLTAEIKKTFVKKDAFTPVQTAANAAIKSLGVHHHNLIRRTDEHFPNVIYLPCRILQSGKRLPKIQ